MTDASRGSHRARLALPPGSCDTHVHVFGAPDRYPVVHARPLYRPPAATTWRDLRAVHAQVGIERAVLVQPTVYATDHSYLIDALGEAPRGVFRGVAVIDESTGDAELARLDAAGVRGARFNFMPRFGLVPSWSAFHRSIERIAALGWFAKIFTGPDELPLIEAEIRKAKVTIVLDHMSRLDFARGVGQPLMRLLVSLVRDEGWWIMISNGDRYSAAGRPWPDAVPFGRALYEAAPERALWGSDWPHVGRLYGPQGKEAPAEEWELVDLLLRYLPDETAKRRVLVDNPARLFGFET